METIGELKEICGKNAKSFIARQYRKTSYYFTWILLYFHLTANQVSALGIIFGMFSTLFFITNNYYLFMIGSVIFFISVMADYCDGEVARYRKYKKLPNELYRLHGGFFDSLNHLVPPMLFLSMSISFIHLSYPPLLIFGIGFTSALFRLLSMGLYGWIESALKQMNSNIMDKRKGHKKSTIVIKLRTVYSALYIPFALFVFSIIGIVLDVNAVFYLWLFYAVLGIVIFSLDFTHRIYEKRKV